jgi:hypothetical protein
MLYTVVNEFGEIGAMQLLHSKSSNSVAPIWRGIAQGLIDHGHDPTAIIYSDNAGGEPSDPIAC